MKRDNKSGQFKREKNSFEIRGDVAVIFADTGEEIFCDTPDLTELLKFKWSIVRQGVCRYAATNIKKGARYKSMKMHRLIMLPPKEMEVDHKDSNGLNNMRSNLRITEMRFNKMNLTKYRTNTSGHKGVHLVNKHRWQARVQVGGKRINLGCYATPEEAAEAYRKGAILYHGEFAKV